MRFWKPGMVVLVALALTACSKQQPQKQSETAQPKVVGEAITVTEVTPLTEMLGNPNEYLDKTVLIQGHVTGRCGGTGCWVSLDTGDPENPLIVRTLDESFIFPAECKDKDIQVQGMLKLKSPEQMEAGAEEAAAADHECPNPEYYFQPLGMKIKS